MPARGFNFLYPVYGDICNPIRCGCNFFTSIYKKKLAFACKCVIVYLNPNNGGLIMNENTSSFDLQVKEQIESLKAENQRIEDEIKPKQKKIEENTIKIKHLNEYLSVSSNIPTKLVRRRRLLHVTPNDTFEDVAVRVLKRHGEPVHYLELKEKMENEENYTIGGKDPIANITAHLSNSTQIIRFERGIYGLKEWKEKNEGSESSKHAEPSY